MISSECTHCHKSYQIEDIHIGKEAECPNCKERFIINIINSNTQADMDISGISGKKKLAIIIIILVIILSLLISYEKINTWITESKRNETLSNPVNLGECKPFTDRLKSCESFTCEYDSINAMINGNIKTKFEINGSNNNCNLVQTNTIDGEPYYETSCKELSEVEYNELASYFDTTLNSNGTEISYEMNMGGESKLRINGKEIKDVLNQLISKGKCTIELKNKYN